MKAHANGVSMYKRFLKIFNRSGLYLVYKLESRIGAQLGVSCLSPYYFVRKQNSLRLNLANAPISRRRARCIHEKVSWENSTLLRSSSWRWFTGRLPLRHDQGLPDLFGESVFFFGFYIVRDDWKKTSFFRKTSRSSSLIRSVPKMEANDRNCREKQGVKASNSKKM